MIASDGTSRSSTRQRRNSRQSSIATRSAVLADIMSFVPWPGFGPYESYEAEHTLAGGERLELAGFEIDVIFTPAPGQKLDAAYGPSTRLEVSASPPELLVEGAGVTTELSRRLVLAPGAGVLQVMAQAATCDVGDEHAACHLTRQDWGVPIRVEAGAPDRLPLVLRGIDG